jgi:hypothetical protein
VAAPAGWPRGEDRGTSLKPADQPWSDWQHLDSRENQKKRNAKSAQQPSVSASPQPLADGGLHWPAGPRSQPEAWYAPLPGDIPSLVDVQLEDVGVGCGLYLGDAAGRPICLLRVVQDRSKKLQAIAWQDLSDSAEVSLPDWQEEPVALPGSSLWLRLVAGCGEVRWWISPDGQHWAQPHVPQKVAALPARTLGVHFPARVPTAGVTLRRIVVRPLKQLEALVVDAREDVKGARFGGASGAEWLAWAEQQRPSAIPQEAWYGRMGQ